MANTFTPLRYPGGKTKFYPDIHKLLKVNNLIGGIYIEPFAGGAGIAIKLLLNNDVKTIVINDIDPAIYAFWYSVLHFTNELCNLIEKTPISVEQWKVQKEIYKKQERNNILALGFSTFFLNRTNISGVLNAGIIGGLDQLGSCLIDARYNKEILIEKIKNISLHKDDILLFNFDAIELFKYKEIKSLKKTFINFDPPYVNKGSKLYKNSFEENDHRNLATAIQKCNRKWVVTYDICPLTTQLYSKYRKGFLDINYSIRNKMKAKEYIFYSNNLELPHDCLIDKN
jgi:DNA adenine methylase